MREIERNLLLDDTIVVVTSRCSHEFEPPLPNSISKEVLKPLRRQGGIARRVLDVAVSEIGLDRARVVAIVGELVLMSLALASLKLTRSATPCAVACRFASCTEGAWKSYPTK